MLLELGGISFICSKHWPYAHTLFFLPVPWLHTQLNASKHLKVIKGLLVRCATTNLDNTVYLEGAIALYDCGIHSVVWNYTATLVMVAMFSAFQCSYCTMEFSWQVDDRSLTPWYMYLYRASDNAKIASCGADRAVILWDVGTGEILRRYTAHWEVNDINYIDWIRMIHLRIHEIACK